MAKTNAVKEAEAAYERMNNDEWLAYVATPRNGVGIQIDGVYAFLAGDAVPKSHVDRGIVEEDDVTLRSSMMERDEVKTAAAEITPAGADAEPDPADAEAAAKANRAAGVDGF